MKRVTVSVESLDRVEKIAAGALVDELRRGGAAAAQALGERTVWHVSSTERGSGVSELLRSLVGYARGLGMNVRWAVLAAPRPFFEVVQRLNHALLGAAGEVRWSEEDRALYEAVLQENLRELMPCLHEGDVVFLHEPATAGLSGPLSRFGMRVLWRSRMGGPASHPSVASAWEILGPYLAAAERLVFALQEHVPPWHGGARVEVIAPGIDPISSKNVELSERSARAILAQVGILDEASEIPEAVFIRNDGSPGRVEHGADVIRLGRAPPRSARLVVQVSRWDRLKDSAGVLRGFATLVEQGRAEGSHLVLAGPTVNSVPDDADAPKVLDELLALWRSLPHHVRARVDLVNLPMTDVEENGAIVNALQRHATVVVQKSLREGFGLAVPEAMWKSRPVISTAVGAAASQVEDGVSGLLLRNPSDPNELAALLAQVLEAPELAMRLGANGHERVLRRMLGLGDLLRYEQLIREVIEEGPLRSRPSLSQLTGDSVS